MDHVQTQRFIAMKTELQARRAAVAAATGTVPTSTEKIAVAERIGKGLAKTKRAVANTATGVSEFVDGVATSYQFYSADGVEQVPSEVIAAATKPTKRSSARK